MDKDFYIPHTEKGERNFLTLMYEIAFENPSLKIGGNFTADELLEHFYLKRSKRTMEKRYTLREKIAYHNECANTGKKDGKPLTTSQRIHHGMASARAASQLNQFMKMSPSKRNEIVKKAKAKSKSK
jgi:hypothetical protein